MLKNQTDVSGGITLDKAAHKTITVYEKPTCSKCREMNKLLTETGVTFEKVNYHVTPFTAPKLKALLKKMGIDARSLLRTSEATYRELVLARSNRTDDELIDLMVLHPELIQRPIVEVGSRAVLGRPVENVKALLSE
jgi:arsenate reductase (glutaredoxin)